MAIAPTEAPAVLRTRTHASGSDTDTRSIRLTPYWYTPTPAIANNQTIKQISCPITKIHQTLHTSDAPLNQYQPPHTNAVSPSITALKGHLECHSNTAPN
eukprot:GHRR01036963.1.p1 GENE.GHRR01036963.1~~GHRR01036963.1.p1  ORF type:complete len:100 (-),score=2.65 GHRR01036963.1:616-915(-)